MIIFNYADLKKPVGYGTSVISGRRILSDEREGDPRFNLTVIVAVPTANTTLSSALHCIVMEYDATRAAGTRIVPVTDEELRDFPEYWKWMNDTPVTKTWYDGARTAGDFTDCHNRFPAFWNLSCRNMSFAECTSPS
nr:hypothetical protein [uncultured Methanoregula sp.]